MESNIENFWGVAQIPIGVAGRLLVNGEHAQGEFYVPMATVEGTMLASYNRGMKVIRECGGVLTTVSEESMQRSPVFIFRNARQARDFQLWLKDNFEAIKAESRDINLSRQLHDIESYHAHSMVFTRFDYSNRGRCGPKHGVSGDLHRLRMDQRAAPRDAALHALRQFRYREEDLVGNLAQNPWQARHR
jgi:hydroxymethylglutaryl-CoA reductase (NADPH)